MKSEKSPSKKASKSVKSGSKKTSGVKKSSVKNVTKPIKQSSGRKASAPAKKSLLKKVSATPTKRTSKKSSSTAQKSLSKKVSASAKKNQTPDLSGLFDVAFWLQSFQSTMDIYLDLSDENPFKDDLVDEMEDCLTQALKLDSNHVPTLILFAAFRLDFGEKLNQALKAIQKADKLSPGNKKIKTLMQRYEQAMTEASDTKKKSTSVKKRASK